jgi:hypothetical protein
VVTTEPFCLPVPYARLTAEAARRPDGAVCCPTRRDLVHAADVGPIADLDCGEGTWRGTCTLAWTG